MTASVPVAKIKFPKFSGVRCLMMPYIQGVVDSVPAIYHAYSDIISNIVVRRGDIGFLTIDESTARSGRPHRGDRAKFGRALHTEGGIVHDAVRGCDVVAWGGGGTIRWGGGEGVRLEPDVEILLANNIDGTCAIWDTEHYNTSADGDIGDAAGLYPYDDAVMMKAGDVHKIGVFTPHESLPVSTDVRRQFLRIVSSGVYGREPYFTKNPLMLDFAC